MAWHSRFHLRQSPFPLLFKLEVILLTVVMGAVLWILLSHPSGPLAPTTSLTPTIAALLSFTAIGLVIPTKPLHQLLYVLTELLLISILVMGAMVPFFQMLFITVVIRNCVLFQGPVRSIATGIACVGYVMCQVQRLRHPLFTLVTSPEQTWIVGLVSSLTFGLVILFIQLFVDAILKEQESKQELAIAHAQLQNYALQIEDFATVQERNRIARDIHDSLGHSLSIFNLHLEAALRLFHKQPTEAEALLWEVHTVAQQAMQEVSHSVATLRADPLNGQALHLAILGLIEQFELSTGVTPIGQWIQDERVVTIDRTTAHTLQPPSLSNTQKMTVYRIVQESLTNIRKYAAATEVAIRIESRSNDIMMNIADNGKGFDRSRHTSGFGLQGMQERLAVLGGYLEIRSSPHQGCEILASFPIVNPALIATPSP